MSMKARRWTVVVWALALVCAIALLVLPSVASAEACANAEFRVGSSAHLPDCRAYEQVTPTEKEGGLFAETAVGSGAGGVPDLVTGSMASICRFQRTGIRSCSVSRSILISRLGSYQGEPFRRAERDVENVWASSPATRRAGAEAQDNYLPTTARLKPCPDTRRFMR